jgi:hypothetical protein
MVDRHDGVSRLRTKDTEDCRQRRRQRLLVLRGGARRRIAREPGCHKCGSPLTTDERIHLWDGHDYCRTCVETKSPRLARYAAEPPVLEETMPHSPWRIVWQNFVFYWASAMALFGTIAFFAGLENGGIRGGLQGLLVVQLWILPVIVTFSFGIAVSFSLSRPTFTVREGEITVRTGCHWSTTCRLTDAAWFRGRSMQTNFLGRYLLPGGPRVLIVLPRGDEREDRLAPVGFSEFTRDVWTAFLTLADIPHQTALEQKRPLAATVADTFSFMMILVGSLSGCSTRADWLAGSPLILRKTRTWPGSSDLCVSFRALFSPSATG